MKPETFPYDNSIYGWASNALYPIELIKDYYALGKTEKARTVIVELVKELMESTMLYLDFYPDYKEEFEYNCQLIYYLANEIKKSGDKELGEKLESDFAKFLNG